VISVIINIFSSIKRRASLRILIAQMACWLGAVSHFYPIPFPKNKLLLAGCVVGYVICATLYYLI